MVQTRTRTTTGTTQPLAESSVLLSIVALKGGWHILKGSILRGNWQSQLKGPRFSNTLFTLFNLSLGSDKIPHEFGEAPTSYSACVAFAWTSWLQTAFLPNSTSPGMEIAGITRCQSWVGCQDCWRGLLGGVGSGGVEVRVQVRIREHGNLFALSQRTRWTFIPRAPRLQGQVLAVDAEIIECVQVSLLRHVQTHLKLRVLTPETRAKPGQSARGE
ncbi:hypothetical protein BaRGS_00010001 [Batillaria attramentaria]|uniref:Uncharacterized protein n=1 Tax=Batillaria attramentaria TaxID=370345 RepID=A0ABD0LIU3_9CAEN